MKRKFVYEQGFFIIPIDSVINNFYITSSKKLRDIYIFYKYQTDFSKYYIDPFLINKDFEKSDNNNYIYQFKLNNYYYIQGVEIHTENGNFEIEYENENNMIDPIKPVKNCLCLLINNDKFNSIKYIKINNTKIYDDKFKIIHSKDLNVYYLIFDTQIFDHEKPYYVKVIFEENISYKYSISNIPIEFIKVL